ncbi:MAG: acetyl-CoA carboxylase biotin carboxylase subunit [candidate division KSB1 bacterium]|nr:acetyl-CoA carboxylase biotin carboxylase subunit [candidate division KSB1 bacterium]MDZ7366882.1 acetyl-CoA carboxylase biotin carboxylase subunit [candidate division KSB1 bacterium]MDZ7406051.1 acetyl-CoA carboxylase biotin carboxylase subunit [candidate division KSB1 bacterium]
MFRKILVANRGEIAVRVMRTCRELGIRTVAVYSQADRLALHVRMADEAYEIGPPPARESYLVQEKIIDTAKRSGAEAIHPGYGFLSENAAFADAVAAAGLIFIGPSGEAMRKMGDKTAARKLMQSAGVPTVPGSKDAVDDPKQALNIAERVGFPVLIKASAGGGGKGMRLVHRAEDLMALFNSAASEARSAFGDGRVYIEKYVENPRHIEFQIIADHHGHVVHLGERECSIQRRHQKVIEESPSTLLDEKMRRQMGEAAVEAGRSCGYANAGTIEFIVDKNRNFYFLEMNTRLQVEHPVTEMVTGLDLVRLQLEIAAGGKLPFSQEQIERRGHAIECRIYAEDPENNFLPSIGKLKHLQRPGGNGIREDSGVGEGDEISIYYDPMISKLVAWGANRDEAICRMRRALREYEIAGVRTTIPFCLWVLHHPKFCSGDFDTHFVQNEFRDIQLSASNGQLDLTAAALAAVLHREHNAPASSNLTSASSNSSETGWKIRGWKQSLRQG